MRGQKVTVSGLSVNGAVHVKDENGRELRLPLDQRGRFQVYEAKTLPLSVRDKLRITQNGFTLDGKHRLNNGAVYELKGFTRNGDLKLKNGWVISRNYGNIAYGYCQTSHVAQSKTVDRVFVAQSAKSLAASSAEQFYVSISRAREAVMVYTDDKERLAEAIRVSGVRVSAHELLKLPPAPNTVDPFETLLHEKAVVRAEKEIKEPTSNSAKEADAKRKRQMMSQRTSRQGCDYPASIHRAKHGIRY
jgi:hypothetical protein